MSLLSLPSAMACAPSSDPVYLRSSWNPVWALMSGSSGTRSFSSEPARIVSVWAVSAVGSDVAQAETSTRSPAHSPSSRRIFPLALRCRNGQAAHHLVARGRPRVSPLEGALGLVDLGGQRVDGLLHVGERLHLVGVDGVDGRVDVVERGLQLLQLDRRVGSLLVDLA